MSGEKSPSNDNYSEWDMSDVEFSSEQKENRAELESNTYEKINNNKNAKNAFKRLLMAALAGVVLLGAGLYVVQSQENNELHQFESKSEVVQNIQDFVDINNEDLSWFEIIGHNGFGGIEVNDHNYKDFDDSSLSGLEVDSIEMDWWEGEGDIYQAIDSDADGKWDLARRIDPYSGDRQTVQIGHDVENDTRGALTMSGVQALFDDGHKNGPSNNDDVTITSEIRSFQG